VSGRAWALAVPMVVRVNPADSDAGWRAWLAWLAPCHGVMLAKAESGDAVAHLHKTLAGSVCCPSSKAPRAWRPCRPSPRHQG
jgi:citrate lyase beta subunit